MGFAYLDLPDGTKAGIVDVPGHERFIRNMLAGAHGIDLVLFTVAADDGVMPQTEEHFDIVHLLRIPQAIFVVTKTDLVPETRIRAVEEEIHILTSGTPLDGSPDRSLLLRDGCRAGGASPRNRSDVARERQAGASWLLSASGRPGVRTARAWARRNGHGAQWKPSR